MENKKQKEHFVVMYNKDFMVSSTPHLTAMDTYVYFTMKLMAGNVYASDTLYATTDSMCIYTFTRYARDMPQKFVNELRLSLKQVSDNGFIPYKVDFNNCPMNHVYDIGVVWKKDEATVKKQENSPYTLIPISSYNKIFSAFGLSEIMKVRVFYFYIKLSSMIVYKTAVCTYSLDEIAAKTNYSVNTVQSYIKILENYGVLAVYHMGKNVKQYANYPTNVIGQYYNKERVMQYGKDVYYAFCSRNKIKPSENSSDGTTGHQQASA